MAAVSVFHPTVAASVDPRQAVEALMLEVAAGEGANHCGELAVEHLRTGGKRIRARLALQALEALGEDPTRGVAWAAACELVHNASLIHDDLQDGDLVRRGQPALWAVHGTAQAVNAGDLMLMLPFQCLEHLDGDASLRWDLTTVLARSAADTARGQAEEVLLRERVRVDAAAYLAAAKGKTAALFGLPVQGAARIAGRSAEEARALAAPFEVLGLLYQLQDDVVDLYGDKGREAPGADLREGKVSALVVAHLRHRPEDALWLKGLLRAPRHDVSEPEVAEAARRFRDSGALEDVLQQIDELGDSVDAAVFGAVPRLREVALALRARVLAPLNAVGSRVRS